MNVKEKFISKLEKVADRRDPYIWSGQGQKLRKLNIFELISMSQSLTALLAMITYIFNCMRQGYRMTDCKVFDCSGLMTYYLIKLGVISGDTTAQGLYNISKKKNISEVQRGDLVFCGTNEKDITHVGCYIGNNTVIEARGSKYGVCRTKLSERDFAYCGDVFSE